MIENNSKLIKGVLFFCGVILILMFILNIKQCNDNEQIKEQVVEMKQLQDGIVRSQAKYATKEDIEKYAKSYDINLDAIRKDLQNFNANIKGISTLVSSSIGRQQTNIPSSSWKPRPKDPNNIGNNPLAPYECPNGQSCSDPFGYLANSQLLSLTEPFTNGTEVPIGDVTFETWKENPWTINQYPRDYMVTTVLGQDKEGRHYTYHKFQIRSNNKTYTVPITHSKFIEEFPESSFSWWNPRVGFGLYGGVAINTSPLPNEGIASGSVVPNLSFSPFSYGKTAVKPDFVFARIGVGYDIATKAVNFSLAPAMWNIGSKVSFIQNTYIGPVVGVDIKKNVTIGAGFTTDF